MIAASQTKDAHQRGVEAGCDVYDNIICFLAEWELKVIDGEIKLLSAALDQVQYL